MTTPTSLLRITALVGGLALMAGCGGGSEADTANAVGAGAPFSDVTIGDADAPLHMIEYAAGTCGGCVYFHSQVLPEIKEKYVDTGKLRITLREVVWHGADLIPFAIARCSANGGDDATPVSDEHYMRVVDAAFDAQARGQLRQFYQFQNFAAELGISQERFEECIDSDAIKQNTLAMMEYGRANHDMNSTPTLIINGEKLESGGRVPNAAELSAELDRKLEELGQG